MELSRANKRRQARSGRDVIGPVVGLPTLIVSVMIAASPPAVGMDTPTCGGSPATIVGTDGDDVIVGTDGDDVIMGLKGSDRILGGDGADRICGGSGRDILLGGRGPDTIRGGPGDDQMSGGSGRDLLLGGPGPDRIKGGNGSDELHGGRGGDCLHGGAGDDSIYGGRDSDRLCCWAESADPGKHLFVLSGQSNMVAHRPQEAFLPEVSDLLGSENVIVVQDALGSQSIQRWYHEWQSPDGTRPETTGDLYDRLMDQVRPAINGADLASITFIWMQGERDARMQWGTVYQASLNGLYGQFSRDLGREDVTFVVGRLSDFDMDNSSYPHWTMVRDIQVEVAESDRRFAWVNTDDLNDGLNRQGELIENDLHYSEAGYKTLGSRFAQSSLNLIECPRSD